MLFSIIDVRLCLEYQLRTAGVWIYQFNQDLNSRSGA